MMEFSIAPLIAALILSGAYVADRALGVHGAEEGLWARRRWISAAAGISVAYVFVDVLPELAAGNRAVVAQGGEQLLFGEQRIYMLALLSFVVMYGLQYIVLASRDRRRRAELAGRTDATYVVHLAGFAAYSALIGYLLDERAERGSLSLAVYTFAMAVHFLIVDHSLTEEHGEKYERVGRWMLVASVLGGWLIGAVTGISDVVFARLFAILAGGVVITSLRAELPDERRGRFWPFCLGAVIFAVILLFA
jgi:hypothetical protein